MNHESRYSLGLILNPQADGKYTRTLTADSAEGLTCQEANGTSRPAAAGDVMSVDEAGNVSARVAGTAGPWELLEVRGVAVAFRPKPDGPVYVFLP